MLTDGICITSKDSDNLRLFFFELDGAMSEVHEDIESVIGQYVENQMDFFMHRTGKGFHFISPTLITKQRWKNIMEKLKHINPKCPMTTLRWKPNKYPNEKEVWFTGKAHYCDTERQPMVNSKQMCNLLNTTFGTYFRGEIDFEPKRVKYPLPHQWDNDKWQLEVKN